MTLRRGAIIAGYIIAFWLLLPMFLIGSAWRVDLALGTPLALSAPLVALGALVAGAGLLLLLLSIREYTRVTGELPISALPSGVLVETGPYAVFRHPIYLGFTLAVFGGGLVAGSTGLVAIVAPVFALGVVVYSLIEERALVARLGPRAHGHLARTAWCVPHLQLWLHLPLRPLFRIWLELRVLHRERIPANGPFFAVAAHRSYLDPFFIAAALRRPVSFITTFHAMRSPRAERLMRALSSIPRRRHSRDAAAARAILRALSEGAVVGLFPEGERSWSGALGPLRPEALALLARCRDVRVLPLRIEGNYAFWPRWRRHPQRAPVRVNILPLFTVSKDEALDSIGARLAAVLRPDDAGLVPPRPPRSEGLFRLLYRCPACRARIHPERGAGAALACRTCGARFVLTHDLRLLAEGAPPADSRPLAEVYREIRVRPTELAAMAASTPIPYAVPLASEERGLASSGEVVWAEEQGRTFGPSSRGALLVSSQRLLVVEAGGSVSLELALTAIRSATVEHNDELELRVAPDQRLFRLIFPADSVLFWQDLLVAAIHAVGGAPPNRS